MIKIYSQPGCSACAETKSYLDRAGLSYQDHDITADPSALAELGKLGYQATPVVVYGDDHWAGHNPEKLAAIKS
jgi:glutaredoxin